MRCKSIRSKFISRGYRNESHCIGNRGIWLVNDAIHFKRTHHITYQNRFELNANDGKKKPLHNAGKERKRVQRNLNKTKKKETKYTIRYDTTRHTHNIIRSDTITTTIMKVVTLSVAGCRFYYYKIQCSMHSMFIL